MQQTTKNSAAPQRQIVFIEFLRIIAAFLVIVNHTNSSIFLGASPSFLWFTSLSYFFVSKTAVPVFFMISGYTLLNRQDTYKKVFARAGRIALCLLLFSVMYYLFSYSIGKYEFISVSDFFTRLLNKPMTNAFWYLYQYIAILLMLPFLQKMAQGMQKKDFHVFFLLSGFFCGVWPILVHYLPALTLSGYFSLPVFGSSICMLMAGCYMKRWTKPSAKWFTVSTMLFVLMCALSVSLTYSEYVRNNGENYLFFDNVAHLPIMAASACLFYMGSNLYVGEKLGRAIRTVGGLTFGVYLLSDIFINKMYFVYDDLSDTGLYPMIAMFAYELAVFAVGAGITFLLKRVPLLKKLV